MKQKICKKTIEKYQVYLKSLLIKCNNKDFQATKFNKEHQLPALFVKACVDLGFINSNNFFRGNRGTAKFNSVLEFNSVSVKHAEMIADWLYQYNRKHGLPMPIYEKDELRKKEILEKGLERVMDEKVIKFESAEKKVEKHSDLSNISTQELLSELKRRGYSGELTKSIVI